MKKKYDIIFKEPSISDSEIERYMDFPELMVKKKTFLSKLAAQSYIQAGLLSITIVAVFIGVQVWKGKMNTVSLQEKPALEVKSTKENTSGNLVKKRSVETKETATAVESDVLSENTEVANSSLPETNKKQAEINENFMEAKPKDGYPALYEYFANTLQYPDKAKEDSVSGTVIVEFVVNDEGKIEKIKIVKGKSPELDTEAKRLIAQMPAWTPAIVNGKPVSSKLTLPLTFQLEDMQ